VAPARPSASAELTAGDAGAQGHKAAVEQRELAPEECCGGMLLPTGNAGHLVCQLNSQKAKRHKYKETGLFWVGVGAHQSRFVSYAD